MRLLLSLSLTWGWGGLVWIRGGGALDEVAAAEGVGVQRAIVEEALAEVAAHLEEERGLAGVFDAFGDDLEADELGEAEDAFDDLACLGFVEDLVHEGAVDF